MKERPIIFSDGLIPKLRDGGKSQTRRIIKPQPEGDTHLHLMAWDVPAGRFQFGDGRGPIYPEISCLFGIPGDRLWVRETWLLCDADWNIIEGSADVREQGSMNVLHRVGSNPPSHYKPRWRSPIHMPRWASRITLEITDVRVERVASISEADAKAEGCDAVCHCGDTLETHRRGCYEHSFVTMTSAVEEFAELWDSIHGPGAWGRNDWVWAITFRRLP